MEILIAIFAILFAVALATNEQNKINKDRNGFEADDDFDY